MVNGHQVGTVTIRYTGTGIGRTAHGLELAILRRIAVPSGIGAALALLTGILLARRISRPVDRVIVAARAMSGGDRAARVGRSVVRPSSENSPRASTAWPRRSPGKSSCVST